DGTIGSCYASAVWGGPVGTLYIGAGATTIGPTSYGGSIRQVNPATGGSILQTRPPRTVGRTPPLDNAGVRARGTFRCVAPTTPTPPRLPSPARGAVGSPGRAGQTGVLGQRVCAGAPLFVPTETNGLHDFPP